MIAGKSYHIKTFGCQMNEHDTEVLCGILEGLGYELEDDCENADILILNTCAVRQKAEEKVRALLGRLVTWKKNRSGRILVLGGCVPGQQNAAEDYQKRFPYVDIIFGTNSIARFPHMLNEVILSGEQIIDVADVQEDREALPVVRKSTFKAWVTIIYGCNNFCAYCVVPHVRGREKSRLLEAILFDTNQLADDGYREITLLGQNVNSYGRDLYGESRFASLLSALGNQNHISRIRFMTSHPRDFSINIIDAVMQNTNICNHFHLPLQSGSNHILNQMNRGYTREKYLALVNEIRQRFPEVAITTDLIVGFPGETDADFNSTISMVEEVRFDAAYTFVYSPRRGTPAAEMADMVPSEIKKERITRLIEIQKQIGLEINQSLIGKTRQLLVEGESKTNPGILSGRTDTNKLVHFAGDKLLIGTFADVKITEAKTWHLGGERQENS